MQRFGPVETDEDAGFADMLPGERGKQIAEAGRNSATVLQDLLVAFGFDADDQIEIAELVDAAGEERPGCRYADQAVIRLEAGQGRLQEGAVCRRQVIEVHCAGGGEGGRGCAPGRSKFIV